MTEFCGTLRVYERGVWGEVVWNHGCNNINDNDWKGLVTTLP